MATQTRNLHLVKPEYTERADIAIINQNMDIIDSAIDANTTGKVDKPHGLASNKFLKTGPNDTLIWGDAVDQEDVAEQVETWLAANMSNPDSPPLDRSLNQPLAAAPADMVGSLKSAFNDLPNIRTPQETEADLYITDANGNVIAKFVNGHIQTKEFNSAETFNNNQGSENAGKYLKIDDDGAVIPSEVSANSNPGVIDTDSNYESDLYLCDGYGNVVAEFDKGGIKAKRLNGFDYITFKSEQKTYVGSSLTLTVNHPFKKGDHIVLHVNRQARVASYGANISYYADNTPILTGKRADICYIEYVCVDDCEVISAVYPGNDIQIHSGDTVQLEVSLLGDVPIKPTVITIKKDGTGDYSTLRSALDAVGTSANDVLNPYRIEIYPGTYNVMDDYTSEEIATADYKADTTGFSGPLLLNGMQLVGIGEPNEIVLYGYLDKNTWDATVRGEISTLNVQGSCEIENMTIIGENLRYCIHDDYLNPVGKIIKRKLKNVILRGYYMAQDPSDTYGCGVHASGCTFEFENVDFGENIGIHLGGTPPYETGVHFKNCKGHTFNMADNESSDPPAWVAVCRFDNCDFMQIKHTMNYPSTTPHITFIGDGGSSPIYNCDSRTIYNTGDVQTDPKIRSKFQGGVGTVVKIGLDGKYYLATSAEDATGIVVATDDDNNYIQVKGYVKTDRTGITTPSVGDFVGISNNAAAIVQSESDAIGKIAFVDDNGNGYIKLNWRV